MLVVTPDRRRSTAVRMRSSGTSASASLVCGEQERELVAAEAEGAVAGALLAQQLGELAQQAVAVLVAVAVVLELEVVDVEQRERDGACRSAHASPTARASSSWKARWLSRSVRPSRRARCSAAR